MLVNNETCKIFRLCKSTTDVRDQTYVLPSTPKTAFIFIIADFQKKSHNAQRFDNASNAKTL